MFDWKIYHGSLKWLPKRTIYLSRHGSHAYGTNLPTSDEDVRGVLIAPKALYLGVPRKQGETFEQAEQKNPDLVVFDIRKFFKLAADCNPNALEILFTDPSDHLHVTPLGEKLLANREMFLSRKAKNTFSGYALGQLKKIKLHYGWHQKGGMLPPKRADFDLPERTLIPQDQLAAAQAAIQKKLDSWSIDFLDHIDRDLRIAITEKISEYIAEIELATGNEIWKGAARAIGFDENFIALLDRERRYRAAQAEYEHFLDWQKNRNKDRAALEALYGYDTKHAMHLVRLLRVCRELLMTGKLNVKRPDREELLAIRRGEWTYEQIIEWAHKEDAALVELVKTSPLPVSPDWGAMDQLCSELIEESYR